MRVLVVDDEVDIRDLMAYWLRAVGHDMVAVSGTAAALAAVDDTGMPEAAVHYPRDEVRASTRSASAYEHVSPRIDGTTFPEPLLPRAAQVVPKRSITNGSPRSRWVENAATMRKQFRPRSRVFPGHGPSIPSAESTPADIYFSSVVRCSIH
ncbi:hypothetical protein KRMM14A1004_60670 [Krasilnikovia sp. MM14-A1004]